MISILIYGRNDDHGYHYKKRCAISLNAFAEVLTDADDEILFVDYNTPDDLPTLPESILNNLTESAKQKLRVIRVRPDFHQQLAATTHLKIIEPVVRNIALRRSNPRNRWILSTNSDMVFVPLQGASLSDIAARLEDGFYQLPRFEIPEFLWEAVFTSPLDPAANIDLLRQHANDYRLKTATTFSTLYRYDNPGDFQLALREDLYQIQGFDERMVLGWTVDSNLCKRMYLLRGDIDDLEGQVEAYHCNHTRKESVLHNQKSVYNCPKKFAEDVTTPYLHDQKTRWGYPDVMFEEVNLHETAFSKFSQTLLTLLSQSKAENNRILLDADNDAQYDRQHIFPYIADHLATLHQQTDIAYIGFSREFADLLGAFWTEMEYTGRLVMPNLTEADKVPDSCRVVIVDMLPNDTSSIDSVKNYFSNLNKQFMKVPHRSRIKVIGMNIDKCNRLLKLKKAINVVARSTASNLIYGYFK